MERGGALLRKRVPVIKLHGIVQAAAFSPVRTKFGVPEGVCHTQSGPDGASEAEQAIVGVRTSGGLRRRPYAAVVRTDGGGD
ncbi:hypothetical protein VTO73DRAFT_10068 [Trametes versicolor]